MKPIAKWATPAGVHVLEAKCRDGRWVVSGVGLGTARCPECDALSSRRQGWQIRQLLDLAVQGSQVILKVKVTRWRCQNRHCPRQTFADRLPRVAYTSGGRPAECLLSRLGLPQSDDTVLRNLKRHVGTRSQTRPCGL